MNRRQFFRTAAYSAAAGGACYGFYEAGWVRIDRRTISVPRLPAAFHGTTVALLTDIHHGPYTDLEYVAGIVRTTNLLRPDLIVLGGDYSLREAKYIAPCLDLLAGLKAPMGVFGVFGNHDYWHGYGETWDGLKAAKIRLLMNDGVWFARRGDKLRLGGVDDLWCGTPDVAAACGDAAAGDCCVVVSHNPDVAEGVTDPRVGLMLSGHTHGGQVAFPGHAPPWVPSKFGGKYLAGLVDAPATRVFVSRGLGTAGVPVRVGSRPEINLITLV